MHNLEITSFIVSCSTLVATIVACIIASKISKKTARYTVHHYINTEAIRLIHIMNEVLQLTENKDTLSAQWQERLFYDEIEIRNIGISLGFEANSQGFLPKKQKKALLELLENVAIFLDGDITVKRKKIGEVYLSLCLFNNYNQQDIHRLKKLDKELRGGNFYE